MSQAALAELADVRITATETVTKHVHKHTQMPVSVSASGKLAGKIRALAHSVFNEARTRSEIARRCGSIVSMTTDRGVELSMGELQGRVESWFSEWLRSKPEAEPDAQLTAIKGEPGAGNGPPFALPQCLQVGGCCHALHNCQRSMDERLALYPVFAGKLRILIRFLRRPDFMSTWQEKLCKTGPFAGVRWLLDKPAPGHAEWQWGTISATLSYLREREQLLRSTWDARKFKDGAEDESFQLEDEAGQKSRVNFKALNEIFASQEFWSYVLLLELLHTVCQRAAKWFEGCACHDDCFRDFNEEHAAAYTSAVRSHDKGCVDGPAYTRHNGCGFASKRTWEMAHGVLDVLIAGWIGEARPQLLRTLAGLPGDDVCCVQH